MSMWTKISEECFQYLVEFMPLGIMAVLKAKGGPSSVPNKEACVYARLLEYWYFRISDTSCLHPFGVYINNQLGLVILAI